MKILKRNYEHRNLVVFLFLSIPYFLSVDTLSRGESILNLRTLKDTSLDYVLFFVLTLITVYFVSFLKKYSEKLVLLLLVLIVGKNFFLLTTSFNKLILILNFIYLIFAFYFYMMWEQEIQKASYNPHFSKLDLEKTTRFNLKAIIETKEEMLHIPVSVTNLDGQSCFVLCEKNEDLELLLKDKKQVLRLVANIDGVEFNQSVQVVTAYDQGLGLDFLKKPSGIYTNSWIDLYKVCLDRGFFA